MVNKPTISGKKKKAELFEVKIQDAPENYEGTLIVDPDHIRQEPKDFLLIGKVQKRNTRPLTVNELAHRERELTVIKLQDEIKQLQQIKEYEQGCKTHAEVDIVDDDDGVVLEDNISVQAIMIGPMKQALKDLRRRLRHEEQ